MLVASDTPHPGMSLCIGPAYYSSPSDRAYDSLPAAPATGATIASGRQGYPGSQGGGPDWRYSNDVMKDLGLQGMEQNLRLQNVEGCGTQQKSKKTDNSKVDLTSLGTLTRVAQKLSL